LGADFLTAAFFVTVRFAEGPFFVVTDILRAATTFAVARFPGTFFAGGVPPAARATGKETNGTIVSELRSVLNSLGFSVANDRNRDLYIYNKSGLIEVLIEVKTDSASSSIYTAVGQLMLNSVNLTPRPRLVFVAPVETSEKVGDALSRLSVAVWKYRLNGDEVEFLDLHNKIAAATA
jgi:hypothetical protein